jgi:hypothetical protein
MLPITLRLAEHTAIISPACSCVGYLSPQSSGAYKRVSFYCLFPPLLQLCLLSRLLCEAENIFLAFVPHHDYVPASPLICSYGSHKSPSPRINSRAPAKPPTPRTKAVL